MFLLILSIALALQAWTWTHLARRVVSGELPRLSASARYAMWASVPAVVFLMGFFGAVGLEELLGLALIPETLARATVLIMAGLLGIAVLGSLVFVVRCAFLKHKSVA